MSADRRRKSRLAGAHPAYGDSEIPTGRSPAVRASAIPEPYQSDAQGDLDDRERSLLTTCEDTVRGLYAQFWATGKALQVIRDARLYRGTHPTFEAYVEDVWGMSRPQAYRLIQAWPVAEAVSPIGDTAITESQVRELVPLASEHGPGAAATVYAVITEAGQRPTAAVIKGAVDALPAGQWDPADARERIHRYLAGDLPTPTPNAGPDPAAAFTGSAERAVAALRRTVRPDTIRAAAAADPERVEEFVAALRTIADEIEKEVKHR